jgi:chemotaxis protein MotA
MLEGGTVSDVRQMTAALIVLGGTLGAVMVTVPTEPLLGALRLFPSLFLQPSPRPKELLERLVAFSFIARHQGIVALENHLVEIEDPFFRKALGLAADGVSAEQLREILETEITLALRRGEAEVRVYESAGGYAPTMGIIGAVLGLIQVMKHLENIDEVGRGIAVAFVATVYGVGIANILLLPAAHKLRARLQYHLQLKQLIVEGTLGMMGGLNPIMIRKSLEGFCPDEGRRRSVVTAPADGHASRVARRVEGT